MSLLKATFVLIVLNAITGRSYGAPNNANDADDTTANAVKASGLDRDR